MRAQGLAPQEREDRAPGAAARAAARRAIRAVAAGEKRSRDRGYRLRSQSARMRSARISTGSISQSVLSRSKQIARTGMSFMRGHSTNCSPGQQEYSSWSLRPWILMKRVAIRRVPRSQRTRLSPTTRTAPTALSGIRWRSANARAPARLAARAARHSWRAPKCIRPRGCSASTAWPTPMYAPVVLRLRTYGAQVREA